MIGIIGKKIGMSQIFDENGGMIPVTVVEAGPCIVTQVKTVKKDGYSAVQVGYSEKPERFVKKPEKGYFDSIKVKPLKYLKEFRGFPSENSKVGKAITVEMFQVGDTVKTTGTSKGKGFQGVMKRYGFSGGPRTHGQSDRSRAPGSIGQSAYPSRVIKGLKMAGRTGGKKITTRSMRIAKIDKDNNLLYIKGAVPGAKNSIVTIRRYES